MSMFSKDTRQNLPGLLPAGAWNDLQSRYSEPHRHYHTWAHIEDMLRMYYEVRSKLTMKSSVIGAILYHDSVYNPEASDNEEQSASLALETYADDKAVIGVRKAIEGMILATKTHEIGDPYGVAGDVSDYEYFLDMDLASLGVLEEQFDHNGKNIRKEYSHLSDEEYETGRLKFFDSFLARDRIYFTDYFYNKFEAQARANLIRSKKILEK